MPKKHSKHKAKEDKEWLIVVYLWAMGLGLVGYAVVETVFRTSLSHPFHWLSALVGGVLGIGIGWL